MNPQQSETSEFDKYKNGFYYDNYLYYYYTGRNLKRTVIVNKLNNGPEILIRQTNSAT